MATCPNCNFWCRTRKGLQQHINSRDDCTYFVTHGNADPDAEKEDDDADPDAEKEDDDADPDAEKEDDDADPDSEETDLVVDEEESARLKFLFT
jgi:hypothetical protein